MLEAKDLTEGKQIVTAVVNLNQSVSKLERDVPLLLKKLEGVVAVQEAAKLSLNDGSDKKVDLHPHDKCLACRSLGIKARDLGQEQILAIPGVKEAVEYYQAMATIGYKEQSWYKVPQVANAVQLHQLMMTSSETQVGT